MNIRMLSPLFLSFFVGTNVYATQVRSFSIDCKSKKAKMVLKGKMSGGLYKIYLDAQKGEEILFKTFSEKDSDVKFNLSAPEQIASSIGEYNIAIGDQITDQMTAVVNAVDIKIRDNDTVHRINASRFSGSDYAFKEYGISTQVFEKTGFANFDGHAMSCSFAWSSW